MKNILTVTLLTVILGAIVLSPLPDSKLAEMTALAQSNSSCEIEAESGFHGRRVRLLIGNIDVFTADSRDSSFDQDLEKLSLLAANFAATGCFSR